MESVDKFWAEISQIWERGGISSVISDGMVSRSPCAKRKIIGRNWGHIGSAEHRRDVFITEMIERKQRRKEMSLSQVPNGRRVTIVSLNLPDQGVRRLTSLGLIPGARIRVVDNSMKKTSLIECRGARLALGRGLPDFIEVE